MGPNLFFLSQDIFTYFLSLEGALTDLFFYLKFYRCLFSLLREGLLLSKERKLLNIIIYNAPHCEWGYLDGSAGKEPSCNAGDTGLIPGSGRSAGEGTGYPLQYAWASLVAQLVKNPPAMQETWVRSLGWEDPLEKGKATYSSILAWRIPWTVYSPWGHKELDTIEQLSHYSL